MAPLSEAAFVALAERLRAALRLHCYRMLGSSHDSDDVVQEALTRAWKTRGALSDEAAGSAWLYRIATNVCLDELARRKARRWPIDAVPPVAEVVDVFGDADLEAWLEPCPDHWLTATSAEAHLILKQNVTLAFIAALQRLTPSQRATLLLRDVVGLTAEQTAEALETTVSAANSALFRARAQLKDVPSTGEPVDPALLERYLRTWREGDFDAFLAMLHDEVKTTMPPSSYWLDGLAANAAFYRQMFSSERSAGLRIIPLAANGQPAGAFYRPGASGGPATVRAVHVLDVQAGRVRGIHHFMVPALFPLFGLREQF